MNYKRTELDGNVGFTSVVDSKFNTCSLRITMIVPMNCVTASEYSVAVNILSDVNSKFNTIAAMNEKLSELYGAAIGSSVTQKGDLQLLSLNSSWLSNKYAIDGEDITAEMLQIVSDCLFAPLANESGFNEEIFKLSQKEILDIIDASFNNKREFTLMKAREIAFEGEPARFGDNGKRENVESVTGKSAYAAYKKLLETAQIEIFFISPEEDSRVQKLFSDKFSSLNRTAAENNFFAPSPLKKQPLLVTEEYEVNQAKIAINFKYDTKDIDAVHLMCVIFGGTPVSKLFMNVREKLSLCYYCACRLSELKNTITVDCGVEKANIQAATDEIMAQLEEIRKGNISDEELNSALLALENSYTAYGDTPGSYISWLFDCFVKKEYITPQEYFQRILSVTRERIIAAAENIQLDSTYHMLNKEAE